MSFDTQSCDDMAATMTLPGAVDVADDVDQEGKGRSQIRFDPRVDIEYLDPPRDSDAGIHKICQQSDQVASNAMLKIMSLKIIIPFILNSVWLSMANLDSCDGGARQSFHYFAFVFDLYYMLVKGAMTSMMFYTFMPDTCSSERRRIIVHVVFAFLMPTFALCFHLIWHSLGLTSDGDLSWVLLKVSFPGAAALTFGFYTPIYILTLYKTPESRLFCLKRFLLMMMALVCWLCSVAASHFYLYFFFHVQHGYSADESMARKFLFEIGMVLAFANIFIPVTGKIWWFWLRQVDHHAPMKDVQRQRYVYLVSVLLDSQRFFYARQAFMGLSATWAFYLVIVKDALYDMYHFGIKGHPAFATVLMMGSIKTPHRRRRGSNTERVEARCLISFDQLVDFTTLYKNLVSTWRVTMDAGYRYACPEDPAYIRDEHAVHPSLCGILKRTDHMLWYFICDHVVKIHRIPHAACEKFAFLGSMPVEQRRTVLKAMKVPLPPVGSAVQDRATVETLAVDVSREDMVDAQWTSEFESYEDNMDALGRLLPVEPYMMDLYAPILVRINALCFIRYRVRLAVKLTSSAMFLLTSYLIRISPSKHIMNYHRDHTKPLSVDALVMGLSMLLLDLAEGFYLSRLHLPGGRQVRNYALQRFSLLFDFKPFLYVLVLCMICCNADVFVTFPNLDFC